MTLRDWMNRHFFESANPYKICGEDGAELSIAWDEYKNYDFVKYIPGNSKSDDKIIVKLKK